jgi:hypothetical protein
MSLVPNGQFGNRSRPTNAQARIFRMKAILARGMIDGGVKIYELTIRRESLKAVSKSLRD